VGATSCSGGRSFRTASTKGAQVGELARRELGDGTLIDTVQAAPDRIAKTRALIDRRTTIFEGTFGPESVAYSIT
jgi:hypothetical protein